MTFCEKPIDAIRCSDCLIGTLKRDPSTQGVATLVAIENGGVTGVPLPWLAVVGGMIWSGGPMVAWGCWLLNAAMRECKVRG